MKKIIFNIAIIFSFITVQAQDTTKVIDQNTPKTEDFFETPKTETSTEPSSSKKNNKIQIGLKNEDNVLPRWSVDLTYHFGKVNSNMTNMLFDTSNYKNFMDSVFANPKYTNNSSKGLNFQLSYFLGKSRRFGIGTGLYWQHHVGNIEMDKFHVQYQSTDNNNDIFRQILTATVPIKELVKSDYISIPIMLKLKHQLKNKKLGFAVDGGLLLGISNKTTYDLTSGKFDYEAIYKYDLAGNAIYDNLLIYDTASQIITRNYWTAHQTSEGPDAKGYFDLKRAQGFNVALDQGITKGRTGSVKYTKSLSYGFLFQPAITYYLSYNTTFMLGGYYSYQVFSNNDNKSYMLTNKVGEYNSMLNGVSKNIVQSYGINIGFRFFFGEKRDTDGDGFIDKEDNCKLIAGVKSLKGCPDSDGDGVGDSEDFCPDILGSKDAKGCPDGDYDGIPDRDDACPEEPGLGSTEAAYNGCPETKMLEAFLAKTGQKIANINDCPKGIEDVFEVLQKNFINFEYGNSVLLPSNLTLLDDISRMMTEKQNMFILINGHTDNIGSFGKNMKLSLDRANAVKAYLVDKGIDKERIITQGFAYEKPLTENSTEEGRAINRRTEMKLLLPIKTK